MSTCGVKKQVVHALYLIFPSHSTQQSNTKNLKQTLSLRCNSCIFAAFSGSGLACWMRICFNLSHALEIMRSMLVNTACEQNTAKSFACNYVQLLPWPTYDYLMNLITEWLNEWLNYWLTDWLTIRLVAPYRKNHNYNTMYHKRHNSLNNHHNDELSNWLSYWTLDSFIHS